MSLLSGFLRAARRQASPSIVEGSAFPAALYAIGDVHGCVAELKALEAMILADAQMIEGEKWLVVLGDMVDRGPSSAQVIDHLMSVVPAGFRRICLRGNHEAIMLSALSNPGRARQFLQFGGEATLRSYGMDRHQIFNFANGSSRKAKDLVHAFIPEEHLEFLSSLPVALRLPGYLLVHAGLRPGVALERQSANDMMWIRGDFTDSAYDFGATVVHGHTPVGAPHVAQNRINVDTGCYATGRLTAVRIVPGQDLLFLQTDARD
jgi:serine/threonine protein phosphatase 1